MRKFCLHSSIVLLLLILYPGKLQSQASKPDQVELMKQFLGTWTGEIGKDTILTGHNIMFGKGLDCYSQIISKGKVISSGRQLYGYDKESDKIIIAELIKPSPDMEILAAWFTSKNTGEMVLLRDISNPDAAVLKWKFEFKSSNLIVETASRNDKTFRIITLTRELN
jgi:hypothetical protein